MNRDQKQTTDKKLTIDVRTVKVLTPSDLQQTAFGSRSTTSMCMCCGTTR